MAIGKDFWEKHHEENTGWLTGTHFEDFLRQFALTLDDVKGKRVLEIGVGRGHCTESLGTFASELYCCDISEAGLENVKKYAKQVFQTQDVNSIPPVDLAVSHLVFVHCTDDEMLRIINGVNLVDGGRFIFSFSSVIDGIISDRVQEILIDDGSHFFRSPDEVKDLIARSNKELVKISEPNRILHASWFEHDWYYVTVQNKM